jgi:hypothetical protein
MTPAEPQPGSAAPPAPGPQRWYHRLLAVLFATICLEIGCYLAVFPWTSSTTDFAAIHPHWGQYLDNLYVRGAISGLGLVNLYIALVEIFRLRRFARR